MSAPAKGAHVAPAEDGGGATARPIGTREVAVAAVLLAIATVAATIACKRIVR